MMSLLLVGTTYGMLFGILLFKGAAIYILTGGTMLIALTFALLLSRTYQRYMGARNLCTTVQTIDGDDDQYDIKFKRYKNLGQSPEGGLRYLVEDMDTLNRYLFEFLPGQTIEGLNFKGQETLVGWWFTQMATNFPTGVWMGEMTQRLSPFEVEQPSAFARKILRRKAVDPVMKIPVVKLYGTNMTAQQLALKQLNIDDIKTTTKADIATLYEDFMAYDSREAVSRLELTEQNFNDLMLALEDTSGPWIEVTPTKVDVKAEPINVRRTLLYAGIIGALAVVAALCWIYLPAMA